MTSTKQKEVRIRDDQERRLEQLLGKKHPGDRKSSLRVQLALDQLFAILDADGRAPDA